MTAFASILLTLAPIALAWCWGEYMDKRYGPWPWKDTNR